MRGNRKSSKRPEVHERYKNYEPPCEFVPVILRALRIVPEKFLGGLDQIVVLNSEALPRRRRRGRTASSRKKKAQETCRGLYFDFGQIELLVDNISHGRKTNRWCQRAILRIEVARILFHEVGHHIHRWHVRENGNKETIADRYMKKYFKRYLWRNWYRILGIAAQFSFLMVTHPKSWIPFARRIWQIV